MHEYALADAVVTTAVQEARRSGMTAIERVFVSVGELQQIERELLEFCLTEVIPGQEPLLRDAAFVVEEEAARFSCRACGCTFGFGDVEADDQGSEAVHFVPELSHAFMRCPECASPDFEITAGRGITLRRIEGRSPDGPDD